MKIQQSSPLLVPLPSSGFSPLPLLAMEDQLTDPPDPLVKTNAVCSETNSDFRLDGNQNFSHCVRFD